MIDETKWSSILHLHVETFDLLYILSVYLIQFFRFNRYIALPWVRYLLLTFCAFAPHI